MLSPVLSVLVCLSCLVLWHSCDTIQKVKSHLPKLSQELNDPAAFKEIYRYSFDFSKEKGQKSMDVNV